MNAVAFVPTYQPNVASKTIGRLREHGVTMLMDGVFCVPQTSAKDKPVNPELGARWEEGVAALVWSHRRGLRRACP